MWSLCSWLISTRIDIGHGEPDCGERTLQPPHANSAVDQQDGFRRSHQERIPGAAAAETCYCQQSGLSGQSFSSRTVHVLRAGYTDRRPAVVRRRKYHL